ncbi:hypothetical protein A3860_08420 [Niastella vici]|uniref:Uncharacterized protein n=1 Tax=Niastella vici TaxID=1703345 RepID=A0A1V9FHG7_9BACT|nr:DUF6304 family protein [Niastella vici]OQP57646.1 hypothetical protein A3860_08420 [Niastella vici]
MTAIYKGLYKDSLGTREIQIENDFNTLTTEIDGVVFSGSEFDDLSVDDKSKYTAEQLAGFTFLRTPIYQTDRFAETLCNCLFEIAVPQVIIDRLNNLQFYSDLKIEISLGNARNDRPGTGIEYEHVTLSLEIADKIYTGTSGYFESCFDGIRDQIRDEYHLKNCYGCMYGDYSVYGQGSFGTMLCFRNQKEEYSKVTNKDEYMELDAPYRHVQEIYCCDQYEIRKKGAGYRG